MTYSWVYSIKFNNVTHETRTMLKTRWYLPLANTIGHPIYLQTAPHVLTFFYYLYLLITQPIKAYKPSHLFLYQPYQSLFEAHWLLLSFY